MNKTVYRLSLDMQSNVCQRELNMRKKESGRQIVATIRDGFSHYHIADDCRAVFAAKKPDGKILFNECAIKGCDVIYDVTEQTTVVPGITECEFRIYGGDGMLITSPKFAIKVGDTVYDDGDEIESASEFSALTSALTEVNLLIEEVKNLGNDIDPEVLAAAVKEYLAANPVPETDPTVPAWAKQPTKPEYTAAEVGAQPKDFVIHMTDTADGELAPDKTWAEVTTAWKNGARLVCYYNDREYALDAFYEGEEAHFVHNNILELKEYRIYLLHNSTAYIGVNAPWAGAFPVQSVNGMTGAVNLTAEDVGALPNDTVIPTVPTVVSAFTNDSGYQTEAEVIALINTALGVIENGTY